MSRIVIRASSALAIALALAFGQAHAATPAPATGNAIQPFEVEGLARYQDGVLTVNGIELQLDSNSKFDDWWLNTTTLDGRWVKVEGFHHQGRFQVTEVDGENRDDEVELTGRVHNNALWGYQGSDESLLPYNNQWVQLECQLSMDGHRVSRCRLEE